MKHYICHFTATNESADDLCWERAEPLMIEEYPWKNSDRPYAPKTQVKLLHNDQALFVRFDIWENNIRATYTEPNDPVCRDSCVEFFFCPDQSDPRYLSFELNPLGAMLIGLGSCVEEIEYLTDRRDQFQIQTVRQEQYWQAVYTIPYSFIQKYFAEVSEGMRGNFMKCADDSVTPHHGSWNRIQTEIPMFHVPQFFGTIQLEPESGTGKD